MTDSPDSSSVDGEAAPEEEARALGRPFLPPGQECRLRRPRLRNRPQCRKMTRRRRPLRVLRV